MENQLVSINQKSLISWEANDKLEFAKNLNKYFRSKGVEAPEGTLKDWAELVDEDIKNGHFILNEFYRALSYASREKSYRLEYSQVYEYAKILGGGRKRQEENDKLHKRMEEAKNIKRDPERMKELLSKWDKNDMGLKGQRARQHAVVTPL